MNSSRVYIIGIDSATFDVIDPLMDQGLLPNLKSLIRDGSHGALRSTIPPVTPPAWVSCMTGKNPGKHGVFDFFASPSYGYKRPVLNAKFLKAKTIWKILSDHGKKVGVVNMPMTYPPDEINGFIIPGMQYALNESGEFSYPPQLMSELETAIGKYRVLYGDLYSVYGRDYTRLLTEWREIVKIREKTILYLMEKYPWDVFAAVFYCTDVIQHHFWRFYDASHPLYAPSEYRDVISEFYGYVDESIGKIIQKLGDVLIMVVSDHGAGPETRSFLLNKWLHELGLLSFRKKYVPLWKIKWPHFLYKVLRRSGVKAIEWTLPIKDLLHLWRDIDPREGLFVHELIDWKKTRAYSGNHTEQGIYINLKGREPEGIVSDEEYGALRELIRNKLHDLVDGDTGEKLVDHVYFKEELYHGPYTSHAPDILVIMDTGKCLIQKEVYHNNVIIPAYRSSGTHRQEGIFIARGNNIKKSNRVENIAIADIVPTVLYALGLPVDDDMDGKIIKDIFEDSYIADNPVKYSASTDKHPGGDNGLYDNDESGRMKKMLRGLGYIG